MRRASGQVEMGMQPQKPAIASPLLIPPPRPAQSYGQPPCTVSLPTHTPYPSKLQQRYSNDWTQSQCCTDKVERSTVSGASNALTRPPGWGKLIAAFFSCRLCMPTCEAQRLPACERLQRKAVRQEYMARAKQRQSALLRASSRRTAIAHVCSRHTCACSGRSKGIACRHGSLHLSLSLSEGRQKDIFSRNPPYN